MTAPALIVTVTLAAPLVSVPFKNTCAHVPTTCSTNGALLIHVRALVTVVMPLWSHVACTVNALCWRSPVSTAVLTNSVCALAAKSPVMASAKINTRPSAVDVLPNRSKNVA